MARPRDYLFKWLSALTPTHALRLRIRCLIDRWFDKKVLTQLKKEQHTLPSISLAVKKYLANPQNASCVTVLKRNMDEKSSDNIDRYLERHQKSSWHFTSEELKIWQEVHASSIPYMFAPGSVWFPDVFVFHNGLKFLPSDALKRIGDGSIIDGGAAAGDSATMFAEYKPKGIYAIEPVPSQLVALRMTLKLNSRLEEVSLVPLGLSNRSNEIVSIEEPKGHAHTITTVPIDELVMTNKISVIKLDIEGMELAAIHGAKRTIVRDNPILLISIYHTPEDFFEIKPLIESWNLGYSFIIRETEVCNSGVGVHLMLIGYVR
jgi:FkbM family methyltransferase